jgi:predicted enzyme related to lactoylglutathione lyase
MTAQKSPALTVNLQVFVYDCPDAPALAAFYARLLGWDTDPTRSGGDWVELIDPRAEGRRIAFQQINNYRDPEWPDGDVPQQAHLDFYVDSIADAVPQVQALGAVKHPVQPSATGSFMVFADPAGHLFCLCER